MDLNQISSDETSIELYWVLLGNPFMHPQLPPISFPTEVIPNFVSYFPYTARPTMSSHLNLEGFCSVICLSSIYLLFRIFSKIFLTQILFSPFSFHSHFIYRVTYILSHHNSFSSTVINPTI